MSSCPKKHSALGAVQSSRPGGERIKEKYNNEKACVVVVRGRVNLIVRIGILSRVLAQNLHYAPPALNSDVGARIAAPAIF